MEAGQILMYVLQAAVTIGVGIASWGINNAIAEMKDSIEKNAARIENVNVEHKNTLDKIEAERKAEIKEVKTQLNELKSDLPFVYVLREDFIRTLNNVDKQMMMMDGKLDKLLSIKKEG